MADEHLERGLADDVLSSIEAVVIARLEDGIIIYADPAFCQLYGLTTAEVIGHTGVEPA